MIRPKQKSAGKVSLAKMAARASIGACLLLSFFASLAPLAASASSGAAMACCVGKQGHCQSGLHLKRRARPAPEPMCGLRQPITDEALEETEVTNAEIADDGSTIIATSSEAETEQDTSNVGGSSKASQKSSATAAVDASFTKPCPIDCCPSTTGVLRQPRPRETSLLTRAGHTLRSQTHRVKASLNTISTAAALLQHTRPRGPPGSSC